LPDPDVGVRIVAGTRVGEIELSSARVTTLTENLPDLLTEIFQS
jgi:hypothetical protein